MNKYKKELLDFISCQQRSDYDTHITNKIIKDFISCDKAKWEICSDGYYPYCSRCFHEPPSREMSDYCPYCGADMTKSIKEREEQIKRWKEDVK